MGGVLARVKALPKNQKVGLAAFVVLVVVDGAVALAVVALNKKGEDDGPRKSEKMHSESIKAEHLSRTRSCSTQTDKKFSTICTFWVSSLFKSRRVPQIGLESLLSFFAA